MIPFWMTVYVYAKDCTTQTLTSAVRYTARWAMVF